MKKKFIIIGNTGFVGKNLEKYILNRFKNSNIYGFGSKKIDLTKSKETKKLSKLINKNTYIFFLSFNKTQRNASINDLEKNFYIVKNVCNILKINKPKKIIFFSTQSVYGEDTNNNNTTELTLPDPTSFYGIAKYLAERVLKKVCNDNKINYVIARIPRVYGEGDFEENYGPTKFLHHFIKKKPLTIWGDGKEKRDYIFINDLNKIILKLCFKKFSGTVNVCSGKSFSFLQIIKILKKITSEKIIILNKKRSRKKVNHVMNNKKLIKLLGDFKFTSLEKNLSNLYDNR